jgi:benzoyl-CoA reductase/2-hydroxyglutaryl-CoA dehydratase subunit BcrC/BadD/HgdB
MEKPTRSTTATKATETARKVRRMIKNMNREAHEASAAGEPVAYCFFGGIYDEILRTMDIKMVFPENWAPICAAKRDTERFLKAAEAEGYSHNLCTYLTCSLGHDIMRFRSGEAPPDAPDGGLAKPTIMLGQGHMVCDPRTKFFQALQRYHDVPIYVNNTLYPPYDANLQEVRPYYVNYYVEELKGVIEFLERNTGRKMDWDQLDHRVDLSFESKRIYSEVYELRKAVPSPMPTQDAMTTMVPGLALLGMQETVDLYQELYEEVKSRVDNRIGVIEDEKYRLLWGAGIPPWYALMTFNVFETLGAVFAIDVPYRPFDPIEVPRTVTHPLERLAWRWFGEMTERFEKAQKHTGSPAIQLLLDLIEDYQVDGIVMNRAFSCRGIHVGELYKLRRLKEYTDVPSMIMEYDMVDMSGYSEEGAREQVTEFVELVADWKSQQQR